MKKLLVILIHISFSFTVFSQDGLKVFWWNVGGNRANIEYQNEHGNFPLYDNLRKKIQNINTSPDIIILGEYKEKSKLDLNTCDILDCGYQYKTFIKYNSEMDKGIVVYSKFPFSMKSELLPHYPIGSTKKQIIEYNKQTKDSYGSTRTFNRQFIEIKVSKNNHSYSIYPVHLLMPWERITKQYFDSKTEANNDPNCSVTEQEEFELSNFLGELYASARTAVDILVDEENPLINQMNHLLSKIEIYANTENAIIIGDFNVPVQLMGVESKGY